jgi:hypothetical protein
MDFTATRISTDDFTPEQVKTILADARQQIEIEDPIPNSKMTGFFQSENKEMSIVNSLD